MLRLEGFLATGLAGCTAPVADSRPTTPDADAFDAVTRRAARIVGGRARPAVVVLQPVDGATSGTAWFIDEGHLVTNAHVLDELPGDAIEARLIDGRTVDVAVARRRATPNLALLSAELEPPATLQPGDSTSLTASQPLVQIGHVQLGY
jgi:S1-C subfamily serine protease